MLTPEHADSAFFEQEDTMSFSLYDALVPNWHQILGSVTHWLDKA